MDNLSSTEADVLAVLNALKNDADLDNMTHLLLEREDLQENNRLISVLNKLKYLKLLDIKKINLFDKFIVHSIIYPLDLKFPVCNPSGVIPAKAGTPNTKLKLNNCSMDLRLRGDDTGGEGDTVPSCQVSISPSKKDSVKHSKYEIRFFWPSNIYPEIYDLKGLIFNKKYYTHSTMTDKYIVTNNNCNIKIRENELQIKTGVKTINNIFQFKKKKRISFPLKAKKINDLLTQNIFSGSDVFGTPKDLLKALSGSPAISCVDVIKERYVRKMEDHTKIELSLIKIQKEEWKTICIESRNFQKVLALSLLVNQEDAEILSYDEFLQKYGTVNLNMDGTK